MSREHFSYCTGEQKEHQADKLNKVVNLQIRLIRHLNDMTFIRTVRVGQSYTGQSYCLKYFVRGSVRSEFVSEKSNILDFISQTETRNPDTTSGVASCKQSLV